MVQLLPNVLKEASIDVEQTLQLFVDNQACIGLSNTSKNLGQTKDIELNVHFIQNLVETDY